MKNNCSKDWWKDQGISIPNHINLASGSTTAGENLKSTKLPLDFHL
jgi:hypothetical protein